MASWRGAEAFREESKVRNWMLTIAHNRGLNALRRTDAPQRALTKEVADEAARSRGPDTANRIDVATSVARLPAEQRATLDLVFFHELSLEETVAVMDVAVGTVKSRLHRAKDALRASLREDST